MTSTRDAGKMGAERRNQNLSPDDRSNISKEATATRKEHNPDAFKKMGQAGAEARHNKNPEEESQIAKKAAETRKSEDPNAFKDMGRKGGSSRGGRDDE